MSILLGVQVQVLMAKDKALIGLKGRVVYQVPYRRYDLMIRAHRMYRVNDVVLRVGDKVMHTSRRNISVFKTGKHPITVL